MDIDSFRKLVIELAEYGYRFTDTEYGFSKIEKNDIVEQSPGIAVARFRLDISDQYSVRYFVEFVCNKINDEVRLIVEKKELYGLPYLECVWVAVIDKEDNGVINSEEDCKMEDRTEDRYDQDFDTSKYTGDMFA